MYKGNFEGTIPVTLGGTVSVNTLAKEGGVVGMYMKAGVSTDIVPFLIQGLVKAATKVGSQAWAVGDLLYWDNGNTRFTKTAVSAKPAAVAASIVANGAGDTTGDVILLGTGYIAPGSAYTQTYSTADKTVATPTATVVTNAFGTANGTFEDVGDTMAGNQASPIKNNFQECATQINLLVADVADAKQAINALIDDLQAQGIVL